MAFVCQDLFQYMKWNAIVYATAQAILFLTLTCMPFHLHCVLIATTMVTTRFSPLTIVTHEGSI